MGGGENGSAIHEADHQVAELIDLIEGRPGSLKSLLRKNDDLSVMLLYLSGDDSCHTVRLSTLSAARVSASVAPPARA